MSLPPEFGGSSQGPSILPPEILDAVNRLGGQMGTFAVPAPYPGTRFNVAWKVTVRPPMNAREYTYTLANGQKVVIEAFPNETPPVEVRLAAQGLPPPEDLLDYLFGGGGGGGGGTVVSQGVSPGEAALARLQAMLQVQEQQDQARRDAITALLTAQQLEDQRRRDAAQQALEASAYAIPPGLEYFPGFEPTGPLGQVARYLGASFEGIKPHPVVVPTGALASPSGDYLSEVARLLAAASGPPQLPPEYEALLGQIVAEPPVVMGGGGGGGGGGLDPFTEAALLREIYGAPVTTVAPSSSGGTRYPPTKVPLKGDLPSTIKRLFSV